MSNSKEDWEDINLEDLLSDIDTDSITRPMDEYLQTLNSFYTTYEPHESSLIQVYKDFDPDSITDAIRKSPLSMLNSTNYDINALRGDHVVLFLEPSIVSEIQCEKISTDENEGAIRLISSQLSEKKVITKRTTASKGLKPNLVSTYKLHEIVYGLILPKRCDLVSIKLTNFRKLHTDVKKLEKAEKALLNASNAPKIQIQNIVKKFQDINSIIKVKQDNLEAIQRDIHALENNKSHIENSIVNRNDALNKVENDVNSASKEYDNISIELSRANQQLGSVKKQIITSQTEHAEATNRLNQLQTNITGEREALQDLQEELATARREKNLTTFDTAGHTAETKTQLVGYYLFAALTFFGLACMAVYIYRNGQGFMETLPYLVHVSAWDILLSRLPLVAATTLIIGGLSGVFFFLIKHIVSLNTEKMTMLKAGILAEQITNSLDCKDMTDEQILEFKRDTKIKLIMQVFSKTEPEVDKSNVIIEALKAINSK
ncbi:hypothetical protein [Vibrio parahaemolyticus]|uniref:hypothetical protein n=1 Tax=Vibrio parahaemolyticus TaxID=670 RepID=UPI00235F6492|nr:hypothetical protein [Vibrio parahaemolyticus]